LIETQPNDFYKALAKGVDFAASVYGGRDFALAFGGNEMPGYHTGPGTYAGIMIGARHSHLDNAGYSLDQKLKSGHLPEPNDLVSSLVKEEQWRQILSSLVICYFARGVYLPGVVTRALRTAGFNIEEKDLMPLGREIYARKYAFKLREGFGIDLQNLPRRIFETPTPVGMIGQDYMAGVLQSFKDTLKPDHGFRQVSE
jgi:aldehyde:ferredoxin oxidoreductase